MTAWSSGPPRPQHDGHHCRSPNLHRWSLPIGLPSFVDVVRSEWTKARTVPSTMWTLIAAAVIGIGLGALISAVAANHYAKSSLSNKLTWDPTSISDSGFAIAQLAIGVLGILLITSEYSTGAIGSSLAAVPRRGRLLGAKAVVVVVLIFVVTEDHQLCLLLHRPGLDLGPCAYAPASETHCASGSDRRRALSGQCSH